MAGGQSLLTSGWLPKLIPAELVEVEETMEFFSESEALESDRKQEK